MGFSPSKPKLTAQQVMDVSLITTEVLIPSVYYVKLNACIAEKKGPSLNKNYQIRRKRRTKEYLLWYSVNDI